MKITKFINLLFFSVAILTILGNLFKISIVIFIFKPLIVISLISLYALKMSRVNKWYLFALLCCLLGDVFLLFKDNSLFFTLGLVSFLIGHIFFIKIVLRRLIKVDLNKVITTYIPFLILIGILLFVLRNSLGNMFFPVLVYGMIISLFATVSLIANQERRSIKSLYMFIGAIVFIISDSLIAINKFYYPVAIFETLIMATYITAQYLIFRSMILRKKYLY